MVNYVSRANMNWKTTKLWNQISRVEHPEKDDILATLEKWMPKIEAILSKSGTSPTDFTLHDADHSYRVAERMVALTPKDTFSKLSAFELALLLLSAYLHDIGMTPEQNLVNNHYNYLLTGQSNSLDEVQIESLRLWLDEWSEDVEVPLCQGSPTTEELDLARLLTTHYCRHQHVQWSEDWINNQLAPESLGSYFDWTDDLIRLCNSHHQGYKELIDSDFDARKRSFEAIVHLRYLAVLLRVADVLEIDPERTPDIVFQHRDISKSSEPYWYKDHQVYLSLGDNRHITIYATPQSAAAHYAIETMIQEIQNELHLARRLEDENHFKAPYIPDEQLYHHWNIVSHISPNIKPKKDAYEYINGAFRPDTKKILQLLSEKELYGNELVAIRELMQNAFDAVREQIAYERNESDRESPESLAAKHHVELKLTVENGRIWLTCTDDGAGMNKNIISNYLLVSGVSKRPDLRALERKSNQKGFSIGRTGQFGIGVLSYFMLADQVEIFTRRTLLAGDEDPNGWYFQTHGVGSFGELRKSMWRRGTMVRLRIKPTVIQIIAGALLERFRKIENHEISTHEIYREKLKNPYWLDKPRDYSRWQQEPHQLPLFVDALTEYLKYTLRLIPCTFSFEIDVHNTASIKLSPGWTLTPNDLAIHKIKYFLPSWLSEKQDKLSFNYTRPSKNELITFRKLSQQLLESMEWYSVEEKLPDNMGRIHLHIPLFKLPLGCSLFFAYSESEQLPVQILKLFSRWNGFLFKPDGGLLMSWKGMSVSPADSSLNQLHITDAIVEIDWQSPKAGTLSVSREQVILSEDAINTLAQMRQIIAKAINTLTKKFSNSPFMKFGQILTAKLLAEYLDDDLFWQSRKSWLYKKSLYDNLANLEFEIKLPLIEEGLIPAYYYGFLDNETIFFTYKNKPVFITPILNLSSDPLALGETEWCEFSWSSLSHFNLMDKARVPLSLFPDRLVKITGLYSHNVFPTTCLWLSQEDKQRSASFLGGCKTTFPPEWQKLLCVQMTHSPGYYYSSSGIIVWNNKHPLLSLIDNPTLDWYFNNKSKLEDNPLALENEVRNNPKIAALWLAIYSTHGPSLWARLTIHNQGFLQAIWEQIFENNNLTEHKTLFILFENLLMSITPSEISQFIHPDDISLLLPDPTDEWQIVGKINKQASFTN